MPEPPLKIRCENVLFMLSFLIVFFLIRHIINIWHWMFYNCIYAYMYFVCLFYLKWNLLNSEVINQCYFGVVEKCILTEFREQGQGLLNLTIAWKQHLLHLHVTWDRHIPQRMEKAREAGKGDGTILTSKLYINIYIFMRIKGHSPKLWMCLVLNMSYIPIPWSTRFRTKNIREWNKSRLNTMSLLDECNSLTLLSLKEEAYIIHSEYGLLLWQCLVNHWSRNWQPPVSTGRPYILTTIS